MFYYVCFGKILIEQTLFYFFWITVFYSDAVVHGTQPSKRQLVFLYNPLILVNLLICSADFLGDISGGVVLTHADYKLFKQRLEENNL